ncbi:hypothetical protein RHMOL_Rhmol02G0133600 [Rhododendron molle]|uniref:Uncharacterized protein n=1 Tax=Rhododendron molle TaxID=49168 RepID=A0ACC0PPE0_RHOML|nr:hypothetical protein RHMOL_Rhmol02G0133600 [Rhododendron molle]
MVSPTWRNMFGKLAPMLRCGLFGWQGMILSSTILRNKLGRWGIWQKLEWRCG